MMSIGSIMLIVVLMLALSWAYVFLPDKVEERIEKEILKINGQIICFRSLKCNLYCVEYKRNDTYIKRSVKYNLLGNIQWI